MIALLLPRACTACKWIGLGLGWNLGQRALDFGLDHGLAQIAWLSWLAS